MTRTHLLLASAALCATAIAQTPPAPRPGDHPAVLVKRLHAQRGYDYAAQFYPHPAWLYLRAGPDPETYARSPVAPAPTLAVEPLITREMALARSDVE